MRRAGPCLLAVLALGGACGDKDAGPGAGSGSGGEAEDLDGDGVSEAEGDCDDGDAGVYPGAVETCDGQDQDCDGEVDEEALDAETWYRDADEDGYGEDVTATPACDPGEGWSLVPGDCDDTDDDVHPEAQEVCDGGGELPGTDEDCDGLVDSEDDSTAWPADAVTWHVDLDGDGFGDLDDAAGRYFCEDPGAGWAAEDATDCDDRDASVYPGAPERCWDGADDDCDGEPRCEAGQVLAAGELGQLLVGSSLGPTARTGSRLGAADLDGDGVDDLLVASASAQSGAGRAWVQVGLPDEAESLQAQAWALSASGASDALGADLAAVPDLDGDGYAEVLVGAPGAASEAGSAWLFAGPLSGDLDDGGALGALVGEAAGDALGSVLLASAELTGDGAVDLVLVAPGASRVYVHSGPLTGTRGVAGAAATLELAEDGSGAVALASLDLDGDGLLDLVLGDPGAEAGAGAAWCLAGPVGDADLDLDARSRWTGAAGGGAAAALAGVGDLDGDGLDELLLGAPGAARAYLLAGGTTASGALVDLAATVLTEDDADGRLGAAVLGPGDLDGDGVPDLLLGAPRGTGAAGWGGRAALLLGPLEAGSIDLAEAAALVVEADTAQGELGAALAAGDLDDNGSTDLFLGAPAHPGEAGAGEPGAVLILLGPGL